MALDSASSAIGASHILRVRLVKTNVSSILVSSLCACNEYTYKHLPTCICCTYMYMLYMYMTYTCAINYGEHTLLHCAQFVIMRVFVCLQLSVNVRMYMYNVTIHCFYKFMNIQLSVHYNTCVPHQAYYTPHSTFFWSYIVN